MNQSNATARPQAVVSVGPIVVSAPGRPIDLEVKVSMPISGEHLPVLLLSHGHGPSNYVSSLYGYAPLANDLAAHGFVVIQPTHLDSKTLPFRASDHPDAPLFWRSRVEDMKRVLDQLDLIEQRAPTLAGRVDRASVGVIGHSMGGHTVSMLLGASHKNPDGTPLDLSEPRIKAGVLLAAPGRGDALSKYAAEHYPFFSTIDFSTMTTPTLVIAGDADASAHLTTAGPAWHADPYVLSPGPKALVTLFGAGHGLGGVAGYDLAETTDDSPERVAAVQRLSRSYLRTQLHPGDTAWQQAQEQLSPTLGKVESK